MKHDWGVDLYVHKGSICKACGKKVSNAQLSYGEYQFVGCESDAEHVADEQPEHEEDRSDQNV